MLDSNQVQPVISSVVTPVALEGFKTPLLNEYPGASAAYSLRRLKSWDDGGRVVQVRRASDNEHRDFSAADIESGAMLRWVNATVALPLDTASEAAAAYSLRNLSTSYTGNVVDVRRSSDNALEAFSAAEVADGTLTDWVNAPTWTSAVNSPTDPYDTFTDASLGGFSATLASGLGQAGFGGISGGSGQTVSVSFDLVVNSGSPAIALRSSSGSAVVISNVQAYSTSGSYQIDLTATGSFGFIGFSDASVPVDFTVSNFKILADGFVTQWYDQSGNGNHATQGTDASQPKIVDAGSLLNKIKFDGVDDFMLSDVSTSGDDTTVLVAKNNSTTGGSLFLDNQSVTPKALYVTSNNFQAYYGSTSDLNYGSLNNDDNLHFISTNATDSNNRYGSLNGIVDLLDSGTNNYSALSIGISRTGSSPLNGSIKELIIYNSDQSANRVTIEANIGDYYSINLPGGVDPGENEVDGFVSTWYDQSGNSNDATQAVVTSQPKIVDAGSLVANGIDFDGIDDGFEIDFGANLTQPNSLFLVHQSDTLTDSSNEFFDSFNQVASPRTLLDQSGTDYRLLSGSSAGTGVALTTDQSLVSAIYNGASSLFAKNGTATGALNAGSDAINQNSKLGSSGTRFYDGTMDEVIIYDSDQSANRAAIEANINSRYSIY